MNKEDNSYKPISEVVKILNLKSTKGDSLPTHTIRFWEKVVFYNFKYAYGKNYLFIQEYF